MRTAGYIVALCFLALLAFGTVLFGYFAVKVFTNSERTYLPDEVVVISGRIHRVERDPRVQLRVEGQDLPFRGILSHEVVKELELHEGEPVKVGVLRAEQASPPRDHLQGQDFLNIYTLEINGNTVLSLDDYNRWLAKEAVLGKVVAPLMFLCSLGVWVLMFRHRHTPTPKLLEPRTLRFRDVVPVGIVLGVLVAGLVGIDGWYGEGWAGKRAGPGIGGLLLGVAGGLAFGMCIATGMTALLVLLSRVVVWAGKNKRRSVALNIAMLVAVGVMLAIGWKVYLRFLVFGLIVWAVVTVLRRVASAEEATAPQNGTK